MAGCKRTVPIDVLNQIFRQNDSSIIEKSANLVVCPSNSIWSKIHESQIVNKKMNAKAIYTEALSWWRKQQTDIDKSDEKHNKSADINDPITAIQMKAMNLQTTLRSVQMT